MRKRLALRANTVAILSSRHLELAHGGRPAQSDSPECKSENPCPGEYTWFCKP